MADFPLQLLGQHPLLIYAGGGSSARRSRLRRFCAWQHASADHWYQPDLAAWRDHLIEKEELAPKTVQAYLSTVWAAYRQLLRSNRVRQWWYDSLDPELTDEQKWVRVSELTVRLKNAIDPDQAPVTVVRVQDEADDERLWLTPAQAAALVQAPGLDSWKGLRDTALMAIMLGTGLRAAEAVALNVADLRATLGGSLAVQVRSGKGAKQRLVPYGAQEWALTLVEAWLEATGLEAGPVFVGLRRGDNLFRDDIGQPVRLSVRAVEYAMRTYPIAVHGQLRTVTPHDLRRTYARRLYLVGTDLAAIQQNLGHDQQDTTLSYIGTLDADYRAPDDAYGTAWLQPLWEQLEQRRSARSLTRVSQVVTVEPVIDAVGWQDDPVMEQPVEDGDQQTTGGGYVFKIWIEGLQPLIWRRFKVPAGISFETLHDVVQIVMGWENYHLYRFEVGGAGFLRQLIGHGDRSSGESIDAYLRQPETVLYYEYDFGDRWEHSLVLEKRLVRSVAAPLCMAGNRACPPEDCGGPWLYDEFLRARKKRKGRVSVKWQHRIGSYWNADAFDRKQVNDDLADYWKRSLDLDR